MDTIFTNQCTSSQDTYTFNMIMQQQNITIKRTFTGCCAPHPQCAEHDRGSCSGFFRFAAAPRGIFLRAVREAHGG